MTDVKINIQNPYTNMGQATVNGFGNNLSPDNPTIEDLNRTMSSSSDAARYFSPGVVAEKTDPLFGTHIREAVAIVKDWAK